MADPRSTPVLVVDDVPLIRTVVRTILDHLGIADVHEAGDGAAALAMLYERSYSLVISDLNMFPMNGIDFVKFIRMDQRFREIPLVMMTTKEHQHRFEEARRSGANACLIKPFRPVALRQVIERFWPSASPEAGAREDSTAFLI